MKKSLFIAGATILALISCEGSGSGNLECITATSDLRSAADAYSQDSSTENCNVYKTALQVYINNGCAGMDQSAYAELDALPCN
jgi:hypothetical protein